jgi:3-mercaptopyruvate sulfurtransferase SseA
LPPKKKQTRRPVALLVIGFLLMAAAIALWVLDTRGGSPTPTQAANIPFPEIARTGLSDAKGAYDSSSAVFLDVRTEPEYAQSRIPGSKNIPLEELPDRLGELNPEDRILTICT